MGEHDWQSSEYNERDRLAGIKATLARIFGDGENPLAWGFKVASFGSVPIKLHLLFIVYLLAELIFTLPGNRVGMDFVLPRLIAIVLLVMAREIIHAIAVKRAGCTPIEIMLWPLGGLNAHENPEEWGMRLRVALAPLIFNLALLPLLAIPLYLITNDWQSLLINPLTMRSPEAVVSFPDGTTVWWLVTLASIHSVNLVLLVFNLLPMYPLDGARVLESILAREKSDHRAQWLVVLTGLILATVIGVLAIVMQDATTLFALCVVCGLICSMHRRRLQFLSTADMIPGISASSFPGSKDGNDQDDPDTINQEQIDQILTKISKHGIGALSRKERRTLKQATESSRKPSK